MTRRAIRCSQQEAADLSTALRMRTRFALAESAEQSGAVKQSDVAPVIVYDRVKALAYAAVRLPGVFGCVVRTSRFSPTAVF